jgi:membrane protease YdiL (CAAX protease family)
VGEESEVTRNRDRIEAREPKGNRTMALGGKGFSSLCILHFLSIAASWAVWLFPFNREGSFYITVFKLRLDFPLNLAMPIIGTCLPGVIAIVWTLSQGRSQLLQMVSTLLRWRAPFKWYIFAVALPWGIFWVSFGVVLLYFPSSRPRPSFLWFLENLVLLVPFGPIWEELAWRAYAVRELQSHYSQLKSALIIGAYWAIWHIPLWSRTLGLDRKTAAPVLISGIVSVISWSVVFSFMYNRSAQSLPVVIVLHAAFDSATAAVFPSVQIGQLYYIGLSALLSVCIAIILAMSMRASDARSR